MDSLVAGFLNPGSLLIGMFLITLLVLLVGLVYILYHILTTTPGRQDETVAGDDDPAGIPPEITPGTRRLIDWITVFALALVAICGTFGGAIMVLVGDRDTIAELVEDEMVQSDVLSEEALIDVAHAFVIWGGYGLAAAGIVVLLAAILLAAYRLRLDRETSDGTVPVPSMSANALVGAVVAGIFSFLPFSVVIGGGAAGYLEYDDRWAGLHAGILTGVFIGIPLSVFLASLAIGMFSTGQPLVGLVVLAGLLFGLLFTIAMSALGGFVGGYLVDRSQEKGATNSEDSPST